MHTKADIIDTFTHIYTYKHTEPYYDQKRTKTVERMFKAETDREEKEEGGEIWQNEWKKKKIKEDKETKDYKGIEVTE